MAWCTVIAGLGLYKELRTDARGIRAAFEENLEPQIGRRIYVRVTCRLNDFDEAIFALDSGCLVDKGILVVDRRMSCEGPIMSAYGVRSTVH